MVIATLLMFVKIGDFSAQGWNFQKMDVHMC